MRVSPTAGRSTAELRADLDVVFDHDAADLRNLLVGAVGPPREAEAVAADHGAVLDDDAIADDDLVANRRVRVDAAVGPDDHARRR